MTFKNIFIILIAAMLTGCLAPYKKVEPSKNAAFIKFERSVGAPLLGSITRYAKVDDKQQCNQAYSEFPLLAVQTMGTLLFLT